MTYVIGLISLILGGLWICERLFPDYMSFLPLGGNATTQTAVVLMFGFMLLTLVSLWEYKNARKE